MLHAHKLELENNIKDAEESIGVIYSMERARVQRELQCINERCKFEIQMKTELANQMLNLTEASLREKEDGLHAQNETVTHRDENIKALESEGKRFHHQY